MWVRSPPSVLLFIVMDWMCDICNLAFCSKGKLYEHKHASHNLAYRDRSKICEACGNQYETTKREHRKVCPNLPHKDNWDDERRRKASEQKRLYWLNHADKHPWKRNEKFISKPCEHLKCKLKDKYSFVEEYTDIRWGRNFSIDIAFIDRKVAVEVNGNQHYNSDGSLKQYYADRQRLLESFGWLVINIHYSWCYLDDKFDALCNAVDSKQQISDGEHKELFLNM